MSLRKHNQALAFWMSKVAEPLVLKRFLDWKKLAQTISAISIFPNQENIRWYIYIPSIFRLLCDNALAVFSSQNLWWDQPSLLTSDFSRKIRSPNPSCLTIPKEHAKFVFTNHTFRASSSKYNMFFSKCYNEKSLNLQAKGLRSTKVNSRDGS